MGSTDRFVTMLRAATAYGYAVPAFNVYSLESITAALRAGIAARAPIILALGERYFRNMRPSVARRLTDALLDADGLSSRPVALHLDHATDPASCQEAIEAGFDSVMIDASHQSLEENIRITRRVVEEAHARGVSVEAELGGLATGEASHEFSGGRETLTDPGEAQVFVARTGVDALAVSVGTVHGLHDDALRFDFDRLATIHRIVQQPLVLHGGSGVPKPDLDAAIAQGVAKINLNTEISLAGVRCIRDSIAANPKIHLAALALAATAAMERAMVDCIHRLNASGRVAMP